MCMTRIRSQACRQRGKHFIQHPACVHGVHVLRPRIVVKKEILYYSSKSDVELFHWPIDRFSHVLNNEMSINLSVLFRSGSDRKSVV